MRRAAKVDANHEAVVSAYRKCGVRVVSLAGNGNGIPDLLCATRRAIWLTEIKDGSLPPSKRSLTPDQERFHAAWPQPIYIVTAAEQVPEVIVRAHRGVE